jgi:[acyl-carrier-protein] S-malonyltransferase
VKGRLWPVDQCGDDNARSLETNKQTQRRWLRHVAVRARRRGVHLGDPRDAVARAKAAGAKRAIRLPVSGAFHSPLMGPAAVEMAEALGQASIAPPAIPIYANVTAAPTQIPADISRLLVEQVTGRVRWRESVIAMHAAGIERFVEIGAGKVLTGMIKRIAPEAEALALNEPADLEAFAKSLV